MSRACKYEAGRPSLRRFLPLSVPKTKVQNSGAPRIGALVTSNLGHPSTPADRRRPELEEQLFAVAASLRGSIACGRAGCGAGFGHYVYTGEAAEAYAASRALAGKIPCQIVPCSLGGASSRLSHVARAASRARLWRRMHNIWRCPRPRLDGRGGSSVLGTVDPHTSSILLRLQLEHLHIPAQQCWPAQNLTEVKRSQRIMSGKGNMNRRLLVVRTHKPESYKTCIYTE